MVPSSSMGGGGSWHAPSPHSKYRFLARLVYAQQKKSTTPLLQTSVYVYTVHLMLQTTAIANPEIQTHGAPKKYLLYHPTFPAVFPAIQSIYCYDRPLDSRPGPSQRSKFTAGIASCVCCSPCHRSPTRKGTRCRTRGCCTPSARGWSRCRHPVRPATPALTRWVRGEGVCGLVGGEEV